MWRRTFGLGNQPFCFGGCTLEELGALSSVIIYSHHAHNSKSTSESWLLPKCGLNSSVPLHLHCAFPSAFTTCSCFPCVYLCPVSALTKVKCRLCEHEDCVLYFHPSTVPGTQWSSVRSMEWICLTHLVEVVLPPVAGCYSKLLVFCSLCIWIFGKANIQKVAKFVYSLLLFFPLYMDH